MTIESHDSVVIIGRRDKMTTNKKIVKKRMVTIFIVVALLTASISAMTNIEKNNEFTGDLMMLSLEEAIAYSLEHSKSAESIALNEELADAAIKVNQDAARAIDDYSYEGFEPNRPSSKDADAYRITADYIEKQKIRNKMSEENIFKQNVKATYFSVLNGEEVVEIKTKHEKRLLKLHELIKSKFDLGFASKQQVMASEYAYIKAKNDTKIAESDLTEIKLTFNNLIGLGILQNVQLIDELAQEATINDSLDTAIEKGLSNRSELLQAEYIIELADKNLEKLAVRYNDRAGSVMTWKAKKKQGLLAYETYMSEIELDIRTKYLDVYEKSISIASLESALDLAEENLRLINLAYEKGMRVLSDVEKAQAEALETELALSQAVLAYNLSLDAYEIAYGEGTFVVDFDNI